MELEIGQKTITLSQGGHVKPVGQALPLLGQADGVLNDLPLGAYFRTKSMIAGKQVVTEQNGKQIDANTGLPLLTATNGAAQDETSGVNIFPFRITAKLASPEILYARQRERTQLFGGLILLSAAAAALGLLAAWRSFSRQRELNELKSNFVSSVSHELRAPIASVRLMAENLGHGKVSEPERQREYFRFIVQECRRLSSLIENVLDFSRIEQGLKQYEFEPTDLNALTGTTVKLMEPYANEKGVKLELHRNGAATLELNVDGRAIQQALVNLIDNAIKHSAKGETVSVEIQKSEPARIGLSVADHGPGIPLSEQEKIFERFYRLGSELRRETQGVGIGLSVVKHIVKAHGGRVTVQSQPGSGSRFTIELPVE